jgi:hypothetical protein
VSGRDLGHDRKAQAGSPVLPISGVIEAREALEDGVSLVGGHARSAVVDLERTRGRLPEPEPDLETA